jgi:hypothetical protein
MSRQAWVDARLIRSFSGTNRPYPLSRAMFEVGYGLFEPLSHRLDLPPLWTLATSDDPAKRLEFLRVLELFEGTNPLDPSVIDLAMSLYAGPRNSVSPVQLLDQGGVGGERLYALLAGERHVAAALWLWIKGLWPRPLIRADVFQEQEQERP